MPVNSDRKQIVNMYTNRSCSGWAEVKEYVESLEGKLKSYSDAFQVQKRSIAQMQKEKRELELKILEMPKKQERFSVEEKEEIIKKRINGATCSDLAESYRCSSATIHRIVKPLKIDLRKKVKTDVLSI
ncbi:MAG: hypothetical protein ACRCSG_04135 [Cellulosilyticaceae bacterium]